MKLEDDIGIYKSSALEDDLGIFQDQPEGRTLKGTIKDIGVSLGKGLVGVSESALGLTGLASDYISKILNLPTEMTEYPKDRMTTQESQQELYEKYSEPQKRAFEEVEKGKGFIERGKRMITHPSTIGHAAIESAPAMFAGGGVGGGLVKMGVAPLVAGAIGEGLVSAGQTAHQIREESPEKELTAKQKGAVVASGALTSLISVIGGRMAKKLGIAEPDTLYAKIAARWHGGASSDTVKRNILVRMAAGGLTEGFLEEMPQSVQEQFWLNAATGRPLTEGLGEAGAESALVGFGMGAGHNIFTGKDTSDQGEDKKEPTIDREKILTGLVNNDLTIQDLADLKEGMPPEDIAEIDAAIQSFEQGRPNAPEIKTEQIQKVETVKELFPKQTSDEQAQIEKDIKAQREGKTIERIEALTKIWDGLSDTEKQAAAKLVVPETTEAEQIEEERKAKEQKRDFTKTEKIRKVEQERKAKEQMRYGKEEKPQEPELKETGRWEESDAAEIREETKPGTQRAGQEELVRGKEKTVQIRDTEKDRLEAESRKIKERREFYGVRDKVDRGIITVEQARSREWEKKPEILKEGHETKGLPNPADYASELKGSGVDRQESWSRWVQRTTLNPGMDAKEWYKIYDSVTPTVKKEKIEPKKPEKRKPEKPMGEVAEEVSSEKAEEIKSFRTAKGSAYTVNEDGTTTRDKAPRPEHPGKHERGIQPKSKKTWYVTEKDIDKLSIIQTRGGDKIGIGGFTDGRIAAKYITGENKGKFIKNTIVSPSTTPKKGLYPVEYWGDDRTIHFGNKIVEIEKTLTKQSTDDLSQITTGTSVRYKRGKYNVEEIENGRAIISNTRGEKVVNLSELSVWSKRLPRQAPTEKRAIGKAWIGNQQRPIIDAYEFKRGRNKGNYRVTLPDGSKKIVERDGVKFEEQKPSKQIKSITKTLKDETGSSQLADDILRKAADLIQNGVDNFGRFRREMQKAFKDIWDRIKQHIKALWDIVSNQRGEITIGKKPTEGMTKERRAELMKRYAKAPQVKETAEREKPKKQKGVVSYKETIEPITEQDYEQNRAQRGNTKSQFATNLKRIKNEIKSGIDKYLGAISTRLGNINPKLKYKLRKLDSDINKANARDIKSVEPLLKAAKNKMSKDDFADWDYSRKNSDTKKINELIEKYDLKSEYEKVRKVLDNIRKNALDVGLEVGEIEEYWPRILKDSKGFLTAIGKEEDWPIYSRMLHERALELEISVAEMSDDTKATIIANMILFGKTGLGGLSATKQRKIKKIPASLNRFYMDADASLVDHIYRMHKGIEARRFFGKIPQKVAKIRNRLNLAEKKLREIDREIEKDPEDPGVMDLRKRRNKYYGNIIQYKTYIEKYAIQRDYTENIGQYVLELIENKEISAKDEKTVNEILNARFHERGSYGIVNAYKNMSYIDTMGSPISALTQIGDLAWSAYEGGLIPTLKNSYKSLRGKSKITKEDVGIERIAQEFADASTLSRAVSFVFKATGLEKIDSIGKESLLNTALEKYQTQAKKNPQELKDKIYDIFEGETDSVIKDLQSGEITDNVKLLVYNRLLDFQPIALSEMPEKYLNAGNGRIFYMLKTFTIKQFDAFRNEAYNKIKNGNRDEKKQGIINLIKLSMFFVLANMGADALKDWLLGRETEWKDRFIDNALRLCGISKFITWQARTEGLGTAVAKQILPPFKFINALTKDIITAGDEKGLETLSSLPIIGKLAYWHLGRGRSKRKDLWEIRFSKQKRKYKKYHDKLQEVANRNQFMRKHRKQLIKYKKFTKFQGNLNRLTRAINKLKKREQTDIIKKRIERLETQKIERIKRFLAHNK